MLGLRPTFRFLLFYCGLGLVLGCSTTEQRFPKSCLEDEVRRSARSTELQGILLADQEDRRNWEKLSFEELGKMSNRDLLRRQRVGEIFGEGCFYEAKDYAAAALVFQHGETPGECYCLQQVELSFPDKVRKQYTGRNLRDAKRWLSELNRGKQCPSVLECSKPLRATSKDTIHGILPLND